jgi:hypothetical protein
MVVPMSYEFLGLKTVLTGLVHVLPDLSGPTEHVRPLTGLVRLYTF